jgi:hypothetical protein
MREKTSTTLIGGMQKSHHFKLIKRKAKPALEGRHYPSIKRLPSEEEIYDPIKNETRTIRYAIGEPSIFKDEQPEKVVLGDIIFQNGSIIVPKTTPNLIKFLTLSNFNAENKNRKPEKMRIFTELNPERDAEQILEKEETVARAKALVFTMDFEDLRGYARVLGVNVNRSVAEIKHDMLTLAAKDPSGFVAGIDDPLTKRQQVIMDAHSCGVIEISGKGAFWKHGDDKKLITPIPTGRDGVAWFAEWVGTDKEGGIAYREIEKKTQKLLG